MFYKEALVTEEITILVWNLHPTVLVAEVVIGEEIVDSRVLVVAVVDVAILVV